MELSNLIKSGLVYLRGITDYGDSVEDEWLIVYLLREFSKAHPELLIRVADEDGEFLLVEAANVLPNWLSPEIDHCRVWIHGGHLKIIPLQHHRVEQTLAKTLTLPDAVKYLKENADSMIQSPAIEDEAFYRLEKYPGHAEASMHYSTVTIPRRLAYVLHELPKTISAAVEAFYLRDSAAMTRITSISDEIQLPPEDLVTVSVRFSRVLFAQLRSQRFEVPQRWQSAMQSHVKNTYSKDESDKIMLAFEDGMKLTCGYEMLAITAEKHKSRAVRELAIVLEDLKEDHKGRLPTDEEMAEWQDVRRNDSDTWLDINYEDFERELEGKRERPNDRNLKNSGFGDFRTQEDLRKIVSRFEAFLNNESAGVEGADINEMDNDDDNTDGGSDMDDSEEASDMEDKEVSFDEETFSKMMKEMMGLPVDTSAAENQDQRRYAAREMNGDDDETNEEDVKTLALQMEAELKGHGVLRLNGASAHSGRLEDTRQPAGRKGKRAQSKVAAEGENTNDEDTGEELDINYNLAKNLLESFKGQGGLAGPAGNLLGLMGVQLPRDEDDGKEQEAESSVSKP